MFKSLHRKLINMLVSVLLNRCNPELGIYWKTPAYRGVQTKVAYFILLKITYRITNWTPYKHCIG